MTRKNSKEESPTVDEGTLKTSRKSVKKQNDKNINETSPGDDEHATEKPIKIAPKILTTREIGRQYLTRENYLKLCVRETLLYFVFLIILVILASGYHDADQYYLSSKMTTLFTQVQFRDFYRKETITYMDITNVEHIWSYFRHYLYNTVWTFYYSHSDRIGTLNAVYEDAIYWENKIIGRPRVRLLRVKKNSCDIPKEVQSLFSDCYPEYSISTEATEDFGPSQSNYSSAWIYHSAAELGSLPISGELSTYGGGGYYFDFHTKEIDTINATFIELLKYKWLDHSSRALILQFSTYNINENIFFTLTLLLEIAPTGGVVPSYVVYVNRLFMRRFWDLAMIILYVIFILFILWFTIEELYEIYYFTWQYFNYFWNFLDLLIVIFAYMSIGSFVYQFLVIQSQLPELLEKTDEFSCFDTINSARESHVTTLVILFFFAAIKGAKYLNFNLAMHKVQATIHRATKDLACFAVLFFVIFITFSQLGHLLFGSQVRDFRSFVDSTFSLLRTAVGDFDYEKIEKVNNFLGPLYFFTYIFFIYFILVNMFLAIIIDTYSEVRATIRDQRKDLHISDIFGSYLRKILRVCGMKTIADKYKPPPPKTAAEISAYDDVSKQLRRCGFNGMEIDLFFNKFGIPQDKPIAQDEMRAKIMEKLDLEDIDVRRAKKREKDELGEKLMQRVKNLEDNITNVNYKIELIDKKIDSIQQIRARKQSKENEEKH